MICFYCVKDAYCWCENHNLSVCFNHLAEHLKVIEPHNIKKINPTDDPLLLSRFTEIIQSKLRKVQKIKEKILDHSNKLIKTIQKRASDALAPFMRFQQTYTNLLKNPLKLLDYQTRRSVFNLEIHAKFKQLKELKEKILNFYSNLDPLFRYNFSVAFKLEKTEFLNKHFAEATCARVVENFNRQNLLVIGSCDTSIKAFDLESAQLRQIFIDHLGFVISISFTRNNEIMISGSADFTFKLWNFQSGRLLHSNNEHQGNVFLTSFIGNNLDLITADHLKIVLWKSENGINLSKVTEYKENIMISSAYSSLKREALICSYKTIGFFSYNLHKLTKKLILKKKNEGIFDLNPSETQLVFLANKVIEVFDLDANQLKSRLNLQGEIIKSLKFSVNPDELVLCSQNFRVFYGNLKLNSMKIVDESSEKIIEILKFNQTDLLVKSSHETTLLSSPAKTSSYMQQSKPFVPNVEIVSSDNKYLLFGSKDKCIVWDNSTKNDLQSFIERGSGSVTSIAISPDSHWVLTGYDTSSSNLFYWKLQDSKTCFQMSFHTTSVTCLAISIDGNSAISNCLHFQTILWDLPSISIKKRLKSLERCASSMVFISGSRFAVSYLDLLSVDIIDIRSDRPIHRFCNHQKYIQKLFLNNTKKYLISAAYYEGICIYDLKVLEFKFKFKTRAESRAWIYKNKVSIHQLNNTLI